MYIWAKLRKDRLLASSVHVSSSIPLRGRLEGLQVLRAVAALMVVFCHARMSVAGAPKWLSLGDLGVDIFFVISGFVMAYTTWQMPDTLSFRQRAATAGRFVIKRVLRIVPLYWLALLLSARRDLGQPQVWAALAQDAVFVPHNTGAHPDWLFPVLGQGWTLNAEMFFYAILAASLLVRRRLVVLVLILTMLVIAGLWSSFGTVRSPPFFWYGNPGDAAAMLWHFYSDNIVLEFVLGIVLAWWVLSRPARAWSRTTVLWIGVGGFAALLAGHGVWPRGIASGLPAMVVVGSAVLAMVGMRFRIFDLLGSASYSIYLFHWPTFGLLSFFVHWLGPTVGHPARCAVLILADVGLATVICVGIHLIVERPYLRWLSRRQSRTKPHSLAPSHSSDAGTAVMA